MPVLKGIKLNPSDPLKLQFIVDGGSNNELGQSESEKLLSYFLAVLTTPNEDLWVNLSPYEADRVIPKELGLTELGKDMLAQDYILKQLSASLTHPDTPLGESYWSVDNRESRIENFNALNKIWIVPDQAKIHENNGVAIITEASLDVKSEFDTSSIILPVIRDEINTGKHFANVRQIYHSTILAMWFKNKLKDSLYSQYINKSKISGIDLSDKNTKDKIYSLYCEAFKKGVYDFTKKEKDSSNKTIKKQYFSGGLKLSSAVIDTYQNDHILDTNELSTIIENPKLLDLNLTPIKHKYSSAIYTDPLMALDNSIELFEQHRDGIIERKQAHVDNVNMALRAFLNKYFDYLNPEVKGSKEYKLYNDILNDMYERFSQLSSVEKNALIVGTIFHDIGARDGVRDMDHDTAGVEYMIKNLPDLFGSNEEFVEKTSFIIDRHSMMSNIGTDYLASDITKLSEFQKFATVMVNFFDVGARADGTNLYTIDLLLDLLAQAYTYKGEQIENFAHWRLKNAFCPKVMQSYAISNRLDDHSVYRLLGKYKDIIEDKLRIRPFGLFTQLISIDPGMYYQVVEEMLNYISNHYLSNIDTIIVDTDIDFMAQPVSSMTEATNKLIDYLRTNKLNFKFNIKDNDIKITIMLEHVVSSGIAVLEEAQLAYDASIEILEQHRTGIIERKQKHVDNVNNALKAFIEQNFDYLNPELKSSAQYYEYDQILRELYNKFEEMSALERNSLIMGTVLHDLGARNGLRDMDHNIEGVNYINNNLDHIFNIQEFKDNVLFLVENHSMYTGLGIELLPKDLKGMNDYQKDALMLLSLFDSGARANGTNLYPLKTLKELLDKRQLKGSMIDDIARYRVKHGFCPATMLPFANHDTLSDTEVSDILSIDSLLLENNIKVKSFGLYLELLNLNKDAYVFFLKSTINSLKKYLENNSNQFDDIIIDTDIDFMGHTVENQQKLALKISKLIEDNTQIDLKFTNENNNLNVEIVIADIAKSVIGGIELMDIGLDIELSSSVTDFSYVDFGTFYGLEAINISIHNINYNDIIIWQKTIS